MRLSGPGDSNWRSIWMCRSFGSGRLVILRALMVDDSEDEIPCTAVRPPARRRLPEG
jgi:hypothetical protein